MSLSKESKDKGRQLQSVYKSSNVEPDLPVLTRSVLVGSDLVGDIVTLSRQTCEACQRTNDAATKNAKWFCRECEELLCDECTTFHKKFKTSADHNVVTLHVPCSLCTTKSITSTAIYYCRECEDFLCTECKSWHQQFKLMNGHTLINSQEQIREQDHTTGKGSSTPVQQTKDDAKYTVEPSKKSLSSKKVSLFNKKVKYVGKVKVRLADDPVIPLISSSVFLSDSSLLLVDRENKKLKWFASDFKLIQVKPFKITPRHIAINENVDVVISTSGSSIVKLFVGTTLEEKGIINVKFDCWGIDFIDKDRLVVVGDEHPGRFCVYTMDGTELSTTTRDTMGTILFRIPDHVTVDRERQRLYVSDYEDETLVALDLCHNVVLFRYKTPGFNPAATVPADGCINICNNWRSGSVYQISEEGVYNKLLLSEKKCMKYSRTISFTLSGEGFIVGGGNSDVDAGKYIHVYKLK